MDDKFRKLFERLVNEISKDYGNDADLLSIIDEIINYINMVMEKSFKINHITMKEVLQTGTTAFMYATDNVMNYSVEMIRTFQKKLKTSRIADYNPDYNDVTYAMFLIDSIAHELCHCNQYDDNINGVLNEQTYLNSLCFALSHFGKVEYFDKSYEGDAYGNGVAMMRSLCSEGILKNSSYVASYKKQMDGWNFFKKNSLLHEVIYYLDKIPFMHTKRGFSDIIIYANHNLSLSEKKEIDSLMKRYPLITIGLEEENGKCRIKKCDELVEQYFGNYIKYGRNKRLLGQQEKMVLNDIYIYLLIPLLTPEIYNNLCIKYGKNKMDSFMMSLKDNINKKINLYTNAYKMSLDKIKQIRATDKIILQNVDEKYVENKYNAAMIYLKDYNRRIDKFIGDNKKNIK